MDDTISLEQSYEAFGISAGDKKRFIEPALHHMFEAHQHLLKALDETKDPFWKNLISDAEESIDYLMVKYQNEVAREAPITPGTIK